MRILITDMEMPGSCFVCPVSHSAYYQTIVCGITGKPVSAPECEEKRMESCPLIPVPPHGRLIDEEKICGKLRPLIENSCCYNRLQIISETLAHCLRIISDTPTIIPAEGEK